MCCALADTTWLKGYRKEKGDPNYQINFRATHSSLIDDGHLFSIINFILQQETPGPFLDTAHTTIFSINRDLVMIWYYHPFHSLCSSSPSSSLSTIPLPQLLYKPAVGTPRSQKLTIASQV